jgi:hypothetical protein
MMKKFTILAITAFISIICFNSFKSAKRIFKEPIPPSGYTGAPTQNRTCVNCHGDFSLNSGGGNVHATGLPNGFYNAGQVYNFSITVTNGSPMQLWGFAIKAVVSGTSGTAVGTFSTTNPNATVASGELKDNVAVSFNGTSYTYNNLTWTAPSTGSSLVSFYMTGVAADADGSENGDFVYSNSILSIPIPVTWSEISGRINANIAEIEWHTFSESGSSNFGLERSTDGITFSNIKTLPAAGNSNLTRYYTCLDDNLPLSNPMIYYRVKMTDADGSYRYSKMIALKNCITAHVDNIYPTVTNKNSQVHVLMTSDISQEAFIEIYGVSGRLISKQSASLIKGKNDLLVNCKAVETKGVYIIKIIAGEFTAIRKIFIE